MNTLSKASLLVAGPTTGKTFLLSHLQRQGQTVVDTDDIVRDLIPSFEDHKIFKINSGSMVNFIRESTYTVAAQQLLLEQPKLSVTNLWDEPFKSIISPNSKYSIGVFRANPLDITSLSKKRGNGLSTGLTAKWTNYLERHAPAVFDCVIWLPTGIFLSDVVTIRSNVWALTAMGLELKNEGRSFALDFNWRAEEGGKNVR